MLQLVIATLAAKHVQSWDFHGSEEDIIPAFLSSNKKNDSDKVDLLNLLILMKTTIWKLPCSRSNMSNF